MPAFDLSCELRSNFSDPGSLKSGEYLEERVLRTIARAIAAGDRVGSVRVMREWLVLRQEPHTMLAVSVVRAEKLYELSEEIEALREEVAAGRSFWKYYLPWIDEALRAVRGSEP